MARSFLKKNKDELHAKLPALMAASRWPFVRDLFLARAADSRRGEVARQFAASMKELTETLAATDQHFIRCIKPNDRRTPFDFDEALVRSQLQSCGVLAAACVAQAGFPYRRTFLSMLDDFRDLLTLEEQRLAWGGSAAERKAMVRKLLTQAGFADEDYQLGRTMVFGSAGLEAQFAERARELRERRET